MVCLPGGSEREEGAEQCHPASGRLAPAVAKLVAGKAGMRVVGVVVLPPRLGGSALALGARRLGSWLAAGAVGPVLDAPAAPHAGTGEAHSRASALAIVVMRAKLSAASPWTTACPIAILTTPAEKFLHRVRSDLRSASRGDLHTLDSQ